MKGPARAIAWVLGAGLACAGCVRRTITVTSNPPGARVWINDVEVGKTPVEASFTYYGVYDVRLMLDGYQPVSTSRDATQPWWENPPMDLVAEAWPGRIRSDVRWHFLLAPASRTGELTPVQERTLMERAKSFRGRAEGDPAR